MLPHDILVLIFTYSTEPIYSLPNWVDKSDIPKIIELLIWNPRAKRLIKTYGDAHTIKLFNVQLKKLESDPVRMDNYKYWDELEKTIKTTPNYLLETYPNFLLETWQRQLAYSPNPELIELINLLLASSVINPESIVYVEIPEPRQLMEKIYDVDPECGTKPTDINACTIAQYNKYLLSDKYGRRLGNSIAKLIDTIEEPKNTRSDSWCIIL